jgi:hypothetical protein
MMMAVGFLSFKPRPTHAVFTKQILIVFFVCAALISCRKLHSPGVTITTINNSGQTVNTIEIDYPGGSYGIGSLPPGGSRVRWIKPSGSAQLRIDFVDSTGEHQAKPLTLQSGDSGVVVLHILAGGGVSFEDNRQKK